MKSGCPFGLLGRAMLSSAPLWSRSTTPLTSGLAFLLPESTRTESGVGDNGANLLLLISITNWINAALVRQYINLESLLLIASLGGSLLVVSAAKRIWDPSLMLSPAERRLVIVHLPCTDL